MHAPLPGLALVGLFTVSLLGGCPPGATRRPDPRTNRIEDRPTPKRPKLRPAREPASYVLVRQDARLHRFSHEGASLGHPPRGAHAHPPGAVTVYRLVADHGAWLELESLPGWAGREHCHDADPRLVGLALRLFVHRGDVAGLTLNPVTQHYPDGTSLRLAAGASLSEPLDFEAPAGEHIRHLQLFGLALNAEIPAASVGTDYQPSPLPDPPTLQVDQVKVELPAGTILRFGLGARVRLEEPREARVLGTASGQRRVNLGNSCLELVALLSPEDIPEIGASDAGEGDPVPGPGPASSIIPGTPLFWPEGRPAGVAVHMAGFEKVTLETEDRVCLSRAVPLWAGGPAEGREPEPLVVCVSPSAVVAGN